MFNNKICILFSIILFTFSCKPEDKPKVSTPYDFEIPKYFPTILNIPDDNLLTVEGIELGRNLFYDGRLSGRTNTDSLMSCASCHKQAFGFDINPNSTILQNGKPVGLNGTSTLHSVLPLVNLVWNNSGYTWNGKINKDNFEKYSRNIEDIVYHTLIDPTELNGDTSKIVNLLQSINGYPEMFEKAFGSSKITVRNISKAIAQFVRILVSKSTKFDKYLLGEAQLTQDELYGYELFMTEEGADCFHCHGGAGNPLFTTNLFYNNGKDSIFNDIADRFSVTGKSSDIGAYKATTLRNIELTGPYMHDGRFATLDDVLDFYASGVVRSDYIHPLMHHVENGGNRLTIYQKNALKSFLLTLTDHDFTTNSDFGPPETLPDGFEPIKNR